MGSQFDPLPLSRVGSQERATKSQIPQLDFVKPSSGFHPRDLGARHKCVVFSGNTKPYFHEGPKLQMIVHSYTTIKVGCNLLT